MRVYPCTRSPSHTTRESESDQALYEKSNGPDPRTEAVALGSLRRQFSNPTLKLKTLISRWKRGAYRVSQRVGSIPIQDVRGPVVRRIGNPQTFLAPSEVDRLVDDYLAGLSVGYLAQKYDVHRATVSKHLTRNNVVRRQHGLSTDEAAEAVKLHDCGVSMRAIARTLGVDRKQLRRSLVAAGAFD